jgi:hypothetical protein
LFLPFLIKCSSRRSLHAYQKDVLHIFFRHIGSASLQTADFSAFRSRAAKQQHALEAQVADARQDRAAAVSVIEGLQRELREARCECVALDNQRRYLEERALAAEAAATTMHSHSPQGDPDGANALGHGAVQGGATVRTLSLSRHAYLAWCVSPLLPPHPHHLRHAFACS